LRLPDRSSGCGTRRRPSALRAPQLLDGLQLRADRREFRLGGRDLLLLGTSGDRLLGLSLRPSTLASSRSAARIAVSDRTLM
jgi:hypothetical protein